MTALRITLLLAGVLGAVSRPGRLPAWVAPLVAVLVELAVGATSGSAVRAAVGPLQAPIGFLLAAVPLAVLLERLGFFSSLAGLLTRRGRGIGGLWVLAAAVIAVLNLDAGVVLLTPLYVGIARAQGDDALTFSLPPVLLACLASSVLPVSNLTNLIAVSRTGATTAQFLAHLALPSLAAVTVGWVAYRRLVLGPPASPPARASATAPVIVHRRPLLIGGAVLSGVLAGFVGGGAVGAEPWMVALGADAVLLALECVGSQAAARGGLPWRSIPLGTALVAASLGVLASAAVADLGVRRLVGGSSVWDMARTAAVSAAGANVLNNLPALLVALPALGRHVTPALWAVLLGVNMGPVLLVTGSLASLLWLETVRRLGVPVRARDFSRAGLRAGVPGAAAAVAVSLVVRALGGS